jgi:hypothetical protein
MICAKILRVQAHRKRCRADEVREHHRHLTALGAIFGTCAWGTRPVGCVNGGRLAARVVTQSSDGIEELHTVTKRGDTKLLQGLVRQARKNRLVYLILAECRLILPETQASQPDHNVHDGAHSALLHIIGPPGESVQDVRDRRFQCQSVPRPIPVPIHSLQVARTISSTAGSRKPISIFCGEEFAAANARGKGLGGLVAILARLLRQGPTGRSASADARAPNLAPASEDIRRRGPYRWVKLPDSLTPARFQLLGTVSGPPLKSGCFFEDFCVNLLFSRLSGFRGVKQADGRLTRHGC